MPLEERDFSHIFNLFLNPSLAKGAPLLLVLCLRGVFMFQAMACQFQKSNAWDNTHPFPYISCPSCFVRQYFSPGIVCARMHVYMCIYVQHTVQNLLLSHQEQIAFSASEISAFNCSQGVLCSPQATAEFLTEPKAPKVLPPPHISPKTSQIIGSSKVTAPAGRDCGVLMRSRGAQVELAGRICCTTSLCSSSWGR